MLTDQLSLDPHKWLYQPIDCGCLLYRDAGVARKTFNFSGGYAKQLKGKFCLRVCIVNHLTMDKDIDTVVPEVLAAASETMSEYQ
jgi:hypothetical protein